MSKAFQSIFSAFLLASICAALGLPLSELLLALGHDLAAAEPQRSVRVAA